MPHAVSSGFREAGFMRQNELLQFKSCKQTVPCERTGSAFAAYVLQRMLFIKRYWYLLKIFSSYLIKNSHEACVFFLSEMHFFSVTTLEKPVL